MIIQDLLLIGAEDLKSLQSEFPESKITPLSDESGTAGHYLIEISSEDEADYYNFLLDNFLPMSSHNFVAKVEEDAAFRERMRRRIEE